MKKLNYYQAHKNKKPKIKYKKRIVISMKQFVKIAEKSISFRESLTSLIHSMDVFCETVGKIGEKITQVTPKQQ